MAGAPFATAETTNNTTRTITTATTYPDYLFVATTGTATLTIKDGGTVYHPKYGDVGQYAGSNGTVTVTGKGSTWTSGGSITIGDAGVGTMTVDKGGVVSDTVGYIGYTKGGSGTVTVDGTGSLWTSSGILYVGGLYGSGSLTIQNGGMVKAGTTSGYTSIGFSATSVGTLTVTGAGSTLNSYGQIGVGSYGNGTLNVEKGGSVSATQGVIATQIGSTGTATVTGEGSSWTNSGILYVGYSGNGTLNIKDGGAVSNADYSVVGSQAGSTGTVLVTGADSTWTNSKSMTVGDSGTGTLTIEQGGSVSDTVGYVGYTKGGTGTATVTGENSEWTNSSNLVVGVYGKGGLHVEDGGSVSNTDKAYIGYGAGSDGTATVTGAGSNWTSESLIYVGYSGKGELDIEKGGSVSDTEGRIGQQAGGKGTVNVIGTGSQWINSSYLTVGYSAEGELDVQKGGSVTSLDGYIGYQDGSKGTVTVEGAGSSWVAQGAMVVGDYGDGSLHILDGGSVSNTNGFVGYDQGENATGLVEVRGAGSTWTNSADLVVGVSSEGSLTVADGGSVSSVDSYIGYQSGSTGAVTVTGKDSSWASTGDLTVGVSGEGNLTIADGATVSASSVLLAGAEGSTGILNIGSGSNRDPAVAPGTLDTASLVFGEGSGELYFNHTSSNYEFSPAMSGDGYIGVLAGTTVLLGDSSGFSGSTDIFSGATLTVGNGGTTGVFDGNVFDGGTLVFNRADSTTFAGSIYDGLETVGTVQKIGAGTLALTGDSGSFSGATSVTQGTLVVNGILGNASSSVSVSNGGTLAGSGTIGGSVSIAGVIAPGNSPGTLTVGGDYLQQSGSTYEAQVVAGTSTSDRVAVGGTATIENGAVLDVSKWGGGNYTIDAHYTVLTAAGGVSGTYQVTGDTRISAFYDLLATYDANDVYLDGVQTRSFVAAGATPNQRAVAGGVQSLAGTNALRYAIGSLASDAEAQAAFDGLSGDIYSSIKGAMVEDSGFLRNGAVDRLRSAFGGVGASSASVAGCGRETEPGKPAASPVDCSAVWAEGYGAWGNTDGDGNAAGLSNDIGGFMIGADTSVFDTWRLGLLGGYSRSTYDVADRGASGSADNYSVGAYGGSQWGNIGLRLGTTYTWSEVDTTRSIAFPGFADALSSSYQAATAQVFGDVGYRVDAGPVAFEPFAGLAYVNVDTNGFTEQGGLAALTSEGDNTAVTFSTLGVRAASSLVVGGLNLTASGTLGWRHAWGDVTPTSTFTIGGSDPFSIAGVAVATDAALIDAGLTAAISRDVSADLFYSGQFSDGVQLQGIRGAVSVKF